ncbi:MAG: LysR family transcriptional regulator [Rubrivivax sp.]|nr:LysR family transcriptional regulator [Rubrivivax sp.]
MDHLQSMRAFVHIAEGGGVARAAHLLGLVPADAAKALSDLEAHLGTRLLKRPGGLTLTASGRAYLARSRAILAELAAADGEARARGMPVEPSGTLRIVVPMVFAVHQLAKHLPDFHARFPKVTVELSAPGLGADAEEGHDLAIHWRRLPQRQSARARHLARTDVILCAAPEYLDRHGRPDAPGMLCEHSLLLPPRPGGRSKHLELMRRSSGGGGGRLARALVPIGIAAPVSTSHAELAYASALAGLGICGLPSFMAEDAVLEGALERVLPDWHVDHHVIWACTPARRPEASLSQTMVGFLVEAFGGQDRDPWLSPQVAQ